MRGQLRLRTWAETIHSERSMANVIEVRRPALLVRRREQSGRADFSDSLYLAGGGGAAQNRPATQPCAILEIGSKLPIQGAVTRPIFPEATRQPPGGKVHEPTSAATARRRDNLPPPSLHLAADRSR